VLQKNHAVRFPVVDSRVGHGNHIHVGLDDHSLGDLYVMQGAPVVAVRNLHAHGLIGGVGEQTLFARMDGVEETLAGKLAALEDGEAARVEGELGFVPARSTA